MTPSAAIARNQTRQTGPNRPATLAVPRDWPMNRLPRMTRLMIRTTAWVTWGPMCGTLLRPSTAESTVTAGVSMASP